MLKEKPLSGGSCGRVTLFFKVRWVFVDLKWQVGSLCLRSESRRRLLEKVSPDLCPLEH